ncbi:MAG: VOC family protein [Rhodospirillaceae bacterium]|nr:VOC family protein [Rhodospirillaceae bacterium]
MKPFSRALTFFCSRDLAASERFYGGTLGLKVAVRTPTAILWRATDSAYIGVTSGPGREPRPGAAIFELVTADADEVAHWHARIAGDGWHTDGPPRRTPDGITLFFATDPNGYLVEFLHFADADALKGERP